MGYEELSAKEFEQTNALIHPGNLHGDSQRHERITSQTVTETLNVNPQRPPQLQRVSTNQSSEPTGPLVRGNTILWTPAAGPLYPALSSRYTSNGSEAVSSKLGIALRLVNLTVLPTGAALAAVAPTALEAVYGSTLGNQAIPFAILAITIIFSAQSLLLITTLQAVGNTKPILGISLAATIIDLATVTLGASLLGTTAGALGRALLALGTMLLAWQSLRRILPAPVTQGLAKATVLAITTASLLATTDHLLATNLHFSPLARVPLLTAVFAIGFLTVSRALSVFTADDFDLLENALPRFLHPALRVFERLLLARPESL